MASSYVFNIFDDELDVKYQHSDVFIPFYLLSSNVSRHLNMLQVKIALKSVFSRSHFRFSLLQLEVEVQ